MVEWQKWFCLYFMCLPWLIYFLYVQVHISYLHHWSCRLTSCCRYKLFFKKSRSPLLYLNLLVCEYTNGYISLISRLIDFGSQQRLLTYMCRYIYESWWENWFAAASNKLYVQVHIFCLLLPLICLSAAASCLEWRRREVCCNLNVVCRAFHIGHFAGCEPARIFICLVCVNCTDTRVSILSFGGFSLWLSALAGVQDLVIFAGENSKLNLIKAYDMKPIGLLCRSLKEI